MVKAGETLGGIANRAKVPRVLIAEANGIRRPMHVEVGQKLKIPRTRHHIVQAGETGFSLALEYGVPWKRYRGCQRPEHRGRAQAGAEVLIPTMIAAAQPVAAPLPQHRRLQSPPP